MQRLLEPAQNRRVGRKRVEPSGRYAEVGKLLARAVDHRWSRKEFATKLEVDGGERTVSNWFRGETWPREIAIRDRMRRLLGDEVVDDLENLVAEVLGLPHAAPDERAVLRAYRTEAGRKAINDALNPPSAKGRKAR